MGNDVDTKLALMQQSHDRMQKDMDTLTGVVKDGFKQVGDKIDKQYEIFATKEDHKRNEENIREHGGQIKALEEYKWKEVGFISLVIPIITFILTVLYEKLF